MVHLAYWLWVYFSNFHTRQIPALNNIHLAITILIYQTCCHPSQNFSTNLPIFLIWNFLAVPEQIANRKKRISSQEKYLKKHLKDMINGTVSTYFLNYLQFFKEGEVTTGKVWFKMYCFLINFFRSFFILN